MMMMMMIRLLLLLLLLLTWVPAATTATATTTPPQLNGRHFRITALAEKGFLDMHDDDDDDDSSVERGGTIRYTGYLIDVIQALADPQRGNFTYTLLPPSGYGSLCVPRLNATPAATTTTTDDGNTSGTPFIAYDAQYRTQYNCGASDVNDQNNNERIDSNSDITNNNNNSNSTQQEQPQQEYDYNMYSTDMYLGMYYITPWRLLKNQFTIPLVPPYSGTLAMFGTATGIASFEDLVRYQASNLQQPAACAPAGTALIDFIPAAYPNLQVKGLYGGEDEIMQAFRDGTCTIYITDGPIASQFVLRQSQRNECIANGKPIGVIGKPMEFGLSHYAIGVGSHVDPQVVATLNYWITVLMSCNPLDPQGGCTDGNFATFYEGRGGDGSECGYVLYPSSASTLNAGVIAGVVVAALLVVSLIYGALHRHRLNLQRRRYNRRQKAALELARRERELNEFIAHEIRNPLSSALAALNFVSTQTSDPLRVPDKEHRAAIKEDLTIVDSSLQFMNDLLRNMLDVHRANDKAMSLNWGPTDVLRDVLEPVTSILFMRGARVEVQAVCEPHTIIVKADRIRLKQIILNLASNASKFVEPGYIKLWAQVVKETGQPDNVILYVDDSGPGIPTEKRERLFNKFQESLDVLNQGTGIGLSVCKNLSDLMGADLYLDPNFDSGVQGFVGTRFVLNLNQTPLDLESGGVGTIVGEDEDDALDTNAESPKEANSLVLPDGSSGSATSANTTDASNGNPEEERFPPNMSLLFVDDDTLLRRMFCRTVRTVVPIDWTIREAGDGETALRLIDDGERFDLIFMDHYMASHHKQLLGTETVRAMRTRNVDSIICGLSANDKQEEFLQSGADTFLLKPFPCKKDALREALFYVLHSRDQLPTEVGRSSPESLASK